MTFEVSRGRKRYLLIRLQAFRLLNPDSKYIRKSMRHIARVAVSFRVFSRKAPSGKPYAAFFYIAADFSRHPFADTPHTARNDK